VPGGEHKPVAVEPFGLIRIQVQCLTEKSGSDLGASERESEVTGGTFMDGVNGEATGFISGTGEAFKIHGAGRWVG